MSTTVAGVRYLTTRTEVVDFVAMLKDRQLLFPAVVVTRPSRLDEPLIPLVELHAAVDARADVFYLAQPDLLRTVLNEAPPADGIESINVYGGAARVFPAGQWQQATVFTARTREDGLDRVRSIAAHVRALTEHRGSVSYTTSTPRQDDIRREGAAIRATQLEADNARLAARLAAAEAELERGRSAAKPKPSPAAVVQKASRTSRRLFSDAEDEIRFRVTALWAEGTSPAQKDAAPLPEFTVGPLFAASVDEVSVHSPALLEKIARCVLRVLLGNDRDGHKLDATGDARAEDGAVVWRTYVEQAVPSARRLHYWRIPGGGIELSRVVLHEDYRA